MEKDLAFAQSILTEIRTLDRPLGRLMEMVREMNESPTRAALMECCGEFLDVRYNLEERIGAVFEARQTREERDRSR